MLTPFNRIDVNAFLHHFPQRTQFPQEVHPLAHSLDYIIDLRFGGEPSNTKTDTAMSALVTIAEGTENV